MEVWPFLFSRGHILDSQLIVCPSVLKKGDAWGEFSRIVARLPSAPGQGIKIAEVQNVKLGGITLVYKEAYATLNDEPAFDVAGRSVLEIQGVMIRGMCASAASHVAQAAMSRATPSLDNAFMKFWNQTEETGPSFSEGFELAKEGNHDRKRDGVRKHGTTTAVSGAGVLLLLACGLIYWHYSATTKRLSDLEISTKDLRVTLSKLQQDIAELKGGRKQR